MDIKALRILLDRQDLEQFDSPVVKAMLKNKSFLPQTMDRVYIAQEITGPRRRHAYREIGDIKSARDQTNHNAVRLIVIDTWIGECQFCAA